MLTHTGGRDTIEVELSRGRTVPRCVQSAGDLALSTTVFHRDAAISSPCGVLLSSSSMPCDVSIAATVETSSGAAFLGSKTLVPPTMHYSSLDGQGDCRGGRSPTSSRPIGILYSRQCAGWWNMASNTAIYQVFARWESMRSSTSKGHKYLTLVYQIDNGCRRLLWIGKERTEQSIAGFFSWFGTKRCPGNCASSAATCGRPT